MANVYYTHTTVPVARSRASSPLQRAEWDLVEDGFDVVQAKIGSSLTVVTVTTPAVGAGITGQAASVDYVALAIAASAASAGLSNTTPTASNIPMAYPNTDPYAATIDPLWLGQYAQFAMLNYLGA